MKCPVRRWVFDVEAQQLIPEQLDCLKEECAWWVSEIEMCCIKGCLLNLATIAECLGGIEHKTPDRRRT